MFSANGDENPTAVAVCDLCCRLVCESPTDVSVDRWHDDFQVGDPHTPETGCHDGFTVGADVCADLLTDGRHCGACSNRCQGEAKCVAGMCVAGGEGCSSPSAYCDACLLTRTRHTAVAATIAVRTTHCASMAGAWMPVVTERAALRPRLRIPSSKTTWVQRFRRR